MTQTELEIRQREYNIRLVIIPIIVVVGMAYFYYKAFKR
jgi:hypothetical protein